MKENSNHTPEIVLSNFYRPSVEGLAASNGSRPQPAGRWIMLNPKPIKHPGRKLKGPAAAIVLSLLMSSVLTVPSPAKVPSSSEVSTAPDSGNLTLAGKNATDQASKASPDDRLEAVLSMSAHPAWENLFALGKEKLQQGYYEEAQKQLLRAINELKKTNTTDERLLKTRNWLGQAYLRDGKKLDANDAFNLADQLAKQLNKTNDAQYAKTLEGLAEVSKANGQFKKSEQLFKRALELRKNIGDTDGESIALTLLQLAQLYTDQQMFDNASPCYELALQTLDHAGHVPDLTKAYFLDKTGAFFEDQAKMPEARQCFETALMLKDKYSTMYTPVDARKRGLVYYSCAASAPNCAHVFSRGIEIESMHIKDVVAVSTLTAQVYGPDWYLMKAEVTIHNQGKTPITALAEQPTLNIEAPKPRTLLPLNSDAIASELGIRGNALFNRLLHSADYDYMLSSITSGGWQTVAYTPFGPSVFNTVGSWATFTPDWEARARARNAAFSSLASTMSEESDVVSTKPAQTTIGPGEGATFLIYFPYNRFEKATLRCLLGNTVLEFPFTSRSG
jgi:tetratricopeptide (TPR) repeat protein